jgi:hypothetical protein
MPYDRPGRGRSQFAVCEWPEDRLVIFSRLALSAISIKTTASRKIPIGRLGGIEMQGSAELIGQVFGRLTGANEHCIQIFMAILAPFVTFSVA